MIRAHIWHPYKLMGAPVFFIQPLLCPRHCRCPGPIRSMWFLPEEPHFKWLFPFKELYDNVKDSEPMPRFHSWGRTLGQGGGNANIGSANQGEGTKAGSCQRGHPHASSSLPCCTVKAPGAVSKNAELYPHVHPDESGSPRVGPGALAV